ncbi:MAG: hypothetical protein GY832_38165 [Chloroflexi bacterium]|nr:hypothetical protein [Chloroflexota bacterium]
MTTYTGFEGMVLFPQVVKAGEAFLNNCTDSKLPISSQTQRLEELGQLARLIRSNPPPNCLIYDPTVQPVDLSADGVDELILHTQMLRCGGWGGVSTVYIWDSETETWQGTLVWPSPYNDYARFGMPGSVEPLVRTLDVSSANDQKFVLVAGNSGGADHTAKLLTVWQWKDNVLETVFEVRLSDWCAYPEWDKWEITDNGHILVHAAEATTRCEAREAAMYVWENDQFVSRTP